MSIYLSVIAVTFSELLECTKNKTHWRAYQEDSLVCERGICRRIIKRRNIFLDNKEPGRFVIRAVDDYSRAARREWWPDRRVTWQGPGVVVALNYRVPPQVFERSSTLPEGRRFKFGPPLPTNSSGCRYSAAFFSLFWGLIPNKRLTFSDEMPGNSVNPNACWASRQAKTGLSTGNHECCHSDLYKIRIKRNKRLSPNVF